MPLTRSLYQRDYLTRLLDPATIAIVGASPRQGSFGQRAMSNLAGFAGEVLLVNGKYPAIDGHECFDSLAALPRSPDCVVVAVAHEAVEDVVRQCAEVGAGGIVVYASGYAETGRPERAALQQRLGDLAREAGIPLVGPNCIGPCNFLTQATMSFGPLPRQSRPAGRTIGLVSQSGAVGQGLMQAIEHGTSISHSLTCGNSADVDIADMIGYLAEDPDCDAIACVFEGLAEPARFVAAARTAAAAGKPLVVYKMATGTGGAAAALSHTGSMAGSNAAYAAGFEATGAVVVDRLEDLVETAAFFAKAPRPRAEGVAVLSTSGGGAVISADKAELYGISMPQPGPAAQAVLDARIPEFGSARNPCDITAQVLNDPESLAECVEAMMEDDAFGVVVHPHPTAYDAATPRIALMGEVAAKFDKFACVVWMNQWLEGPGSLEGERNPNVAIFRSMDGCLRTIAAWHRRERLLAAPPQDLTAVDVAVDARDRVAALLAAADGPALSESQSKQVLAAYGVPVVEDRLVGDEDAALRAADELGYPVVLKVDSPAIAHKTDAGVVTLDIATPQELVAAYRRITAHALAVTTAEQIRGVSVQTMLPAGLEVIVGARVDPGFGPLVVVGIGGIFVELLRDTVTGLAPVDVRQARRMLDSLAHAELFAGFRGSAPVDLQALAEVVARVSLLVSDHADTLAELDVNPLICAGSRAVAVDGLCLLAPTSADNPPRR
jgi:acyl-CoA synthetase (NDP forming)